MGRKSREKGKRGEREFAKYCREHGYDCRRGQQYNGLDGDDVVGLPNVHIEVKRTERLNLRDAVNQSVRDAAEHELAIVAHRKNNEDWVIIMTGEDFFQLYAKSSYGGGNELDTSKSI